MIRDRTFKPQIPVVTETIKLFRNKEQSLWLGKIEIGTSRRRRQRQYFYVFFDTGSPYVWVTASGCREPGFSNKYRSLLSRTKTKLPGTFEASYTGGTSVEGRQYSDVVTVGEMKVEMAFGSATKHLSFPSNRGDGIFGLSPFPFGDPQFDFFHAAQKAYPHFNPIAAFYYGTREPELHLGEVKNVYLGEIQYYPIIPVVLLGKLHRLWAIKGGDISVGREQVVKGTWSLLDTGAGGIIGPLGEVQKIYNRIPGSYLDVDRNGVITYGIPCKPEHLPAVSISWNNKNPWTISPENLAIPIKNSDQCLGIFVGKRHDHSWKLTIGERFMRGMYIIFDAKGERIGLAKGK